MVPAFADAAALLDVSVLMLMIKAIAHSSMSISIPLLAFSPAFLIFTG